MAPRMAVATAVERGHDLIPVHQEGSRASPCVLINLVTSITLRDNGLGNRVPCQRPLTNAERQARYREKHMESIEGDKERAQFMFEIGTKNGLRGSRVTTAIYRQPR